MHRRHFLFSASSLTAGASLLTACTPGVSHEEIVRGLRRPGVIVDTGNRAQLLRELVRYATLAPSSHNSQCWKFQTSDHLITIAPDLARRCPVVDPDDHHLFVSLGCASENLVQAALAHGLAAHVRFAADDSDRIAIDLEASKARASPLFHAITERQCTRGDYDGQPLSVQELRQLEQAASGDGVRVLLLTTGPAMEQVLEYVASGTTDQLANPAFIEELTAWIRFSHEEAVRSGDGLFSGSSGNPALPRWLGSRLLPLFVTAKSENERHARQIRNSAGIAVFVSETSDKAHWVEAGRCYERFALQATALGIRNSLLNQALEVEAVRLQFASMLGLGNLRPDLIVRFGRGPTLPLSMRRPLRTVLA